MTNDRHNNNQLSININDAQSNLSTSYGTPIQSSSMGAYHSPLQIHDQSNNNITSGYSPFVSSINKASSVQQNSPGGVSSQQQQQQQQQQQRPQPVINRNYLHVQAANMRNQQQLNTNTLTHPGQASLAHQLAEDAKRTRSISRSLRTLFHRTSKREKSYDVNLLSSAQNHLLNNEDHDFQYDLHSVHDATGLHNTTQQKKTIGGSLKKLFHIKQSSKNKRYQGSVHDPPSSPQLQQQQQKSNSNNSRPVSPAITISRPILGSNNNNMQSNQSLQQQQQQQQGFGIGRNNENKSIMMNRTGYI